MPLYLGEVVEQTATWATPTTRDWRSDRSQKTSAEMYGSKGRPLSRQTLEASGQSTNGDQAQTEKRGALDAEFVGWLQGFPETWVWAGMKVEKRRRK